MILLHPYFIVPIASSQQKCTDRLLETHICVNFFVRAVDQIRHVRFGSVRMADFIYHQKMHLKMSFRHVVHIHSDVLNFCG